MKAQHPRIANALRRGSVINLVLVGLLAVVLLGVGSWMYLSSGTISEMDEPLTETAFRGLFVKEVLDQGEIQSSENVEIRSRVKSRYGSRGVTVKRLVEEGTVVKEGDFLVELRSDEIQENFDAQTIAVNNARDAVTAAQNTYDSAVAAKNEYEKGLYQEQLITVTNQISEAQEALERAEEVFKFSTKLHAKGFITLTDLRADEATLERSKRSLELALQSKKVLETYTRSKNLTELESAITIADSKLKAAENNLKIEEATLQEIEEQLDACLITCPKGASGQVVYANVFSRRGSSEFILEEGATVREAQVLIKLPNPDKMQVRATVNESRVTSIEENMAVRVSVDALNGRQLDGVVRKVNQYAEPEGWGGGGVRKYAVYVDILNPIPQIRPGMNSSVLIETDRIENALMVPIQAVYGYRGKTFCLVKRGDKWETVEVETGPNNDTNVVILSGLEEGDAVGMNPGAFKELLDLPDLPEVAEGKETDWKEKRRGPSGMSGQPGGKGPGGKGPGGKGPGGKGPGGKSMEKYKGSQQGGYPGQKGAAPDKQGGFPGKEGKGKQTDPAPQDSGAGENETTSKEKSKGRESSTGTAATGQSIKVSSTNL